jgi:hypothetical protein
MNMKASPRMTRFIPRLSLGALVLAIGFMAKIMAPHFDDPDFYWQVKTGEYLLSSWPLPGGDVFTYTHPGSPWVLSEWLAQIVLYLVFSSTGYFGTAVFVAAMCGLCGWLTYLNCRRHMDNPVHAIVVATAGSLLLLTAAPRPQLFSFVCFTATLYVLLEFKYARRDRLLALLPAILVLWANTHGGFFIGLVLIALFIISEWSIYALGLGGSVEGPRLKRLAMWSAAALLVTLINPQHFRLWMYPIEAIVFSGDAQTINEWQSPSFHIPLTQGFLALVLLFFVLQSWSKRRPDLTEVMVPLVFIASAFYSIRNMPIASIGLTPFLAKSLSSVSVPATAKSRLLSVLGKVTGPDKTVPPSALSDRHEQVLNWALLFLTIIALALGYPAIKRKQEAAVAAYLPVGAADFILAHHIIGRMFNSYEYGGYLIFRLFPKQKVFIYGRTDIYKDNFVRTLDDIQQGRPDWKALFDRYGIDYVVCGSNVALRQLLLQGGQFRLVFDDGNHSVLLKKIERFKEIKASQGLP